MSAEEALKRLESQENSGGIRRDAKGKIIPLSMHARHLFEHAKRLLPPRKRWEKLSPETLTQNERDRDPGIAAQQLLSKSKIFS